MSPLTCMLLPVSLWLSGNSTPAPASWSRGGSSGTYLRVPWGQPRCPSTELDGKSERLKAPGCGLGSGAAKITNEPQWKEKGHEPAILWSHDWPTTLLPSSS